jgi:hypothetical protein
VKQVTEDITGNLKEAIKILQNENAALGSTIPPPPPLPPPLQVSTAFYIPKAPGSQCPSCQVQDFGHIASFFVLNVRKNLEKES